MEQERILKAEQESQADQVTFLRFCHHLSKTSALLLFDEC